MDVCPMLSNKFLSIWKCLSQQNQYGQPRGRQAGSAVKKTLSRVYSNILYKIKQIEVNIWKRKENSIMEYTKNKQQEK